MAVWGRGRLPTAWSGHLEVANDQIVQPRMARGNISPTRTDNFMMGSSNVLMIGLAFGPPLTGPGSVGYTFPLIGRIEYPMAPKVAS